MHWILKRSINEITEHFFRDFKIGNDAIYKRAYCYNMARGAPYHTLRLGTNRDNMSRLWFIAMTDGSLITIPRPLTYTSVFAVPRSIPMSLLPNEGKNKKLIKIDLKTPQRS